jgi:hypothetical protein
VRDLASAVEGPKTGGASLEGAPAEAAVPEPVLLEAIRRVRPTPATSADVPTILLRMGEAVATLSRIIGGERRSARRTAGGVPGRTGPTREAYGGGNGFARLTVVTGPFQRFGEIHAFAAALESLPGVHFARPERFHRGTLALGVGYAGTPTFDQLLASLPGYSLRIDAARPDRIEAFLSDEVRRSKAA